MKYKVYSPTLRVGLSVPFTVEAETPEQARIKVAKHMWGHESDYIAEEVKE